MQKSWFRTLLRALYIFIHFGLRLSPSALFNMNALKFHFYKSYHTLQKYLHDRQTHARARTHMHFQPRSSLPILSTFYFILNLTFGVRMCSMTRAAVRSYTFLFFVFRLAVFHSSLFSGNRSEWVESRRLDRLQSCSAGQLICPKSRENRRDLFTL